LAKDKEVQRLITEAIEVLTILGILFNGLTWRRIERIAMAFLATGQINAVNGWEHIKDLNDGITMKTRDIIKHNNEFFEEHISSTSMALSSWGLIQQLKKPYNLKRYQEAAYSKSVAIESGRP
jgi:hypothetical protein